MRGRAKSRVANFADGDPAQPFETPQLFAPVCSLLLPPIRRVRQNADSVRVRLRRPSGFLPQGGPASRRAGALQPPEKAQAPARSFTASRREIGWRFDRHMSADLVGSERVRRHPHRRAWSAPECGLSRGPRAYRVRVPIRHFHFAAVVAGTRLSISATNWNSVRYSWRCCISQRTTRALPRSFRT